ncbi:hypothetical protein IEQ34_002426 [Dendrobium chrysotoxum]|uniref:DNA topoisomerase (ATP-hydrolyzing) n=1 Tax=Dendrobium chrysotoxum TaxID=161865 RepID=A0AAV7HLT2_DENCH|nr:hypothetical protein IEQ34_002426 [Dendrobium chrysotoxum]
MVHRPVTYVSRLYKIFDEILGNVANNKLRDPSINSLKVDIEAEAICNNGDGVSVEIYQEERVYVPDMIFGHLLTSNNYDDNVKTTTGARNRYGAKLTFLQLIKNEPPSFFELIAACNDAKLLEKLKKIYDFYLRSPLFADLKINNKLLEMYSKCRSMKDARQMLDFMPDRNMDSWHLMINGFASNGEGDNGLHLFENMRDEGVPHKLVFMFWLYVLVQMLLKKNLCKKEKNWRSLWKKVRTWEAKMLLQKMNETTYGLDIMSCGEGTYFVACKNWFYVTDGVGQWSQGKEIHYYAIRYGFNTDVHIKSALIARQATVDFRKEHRSAGEQNTEGTTALSRRIK